MGGMRGVGFGALLGLDDFRKDAFSTGYHAYLLQQKYPHSEISISCPRLRPVINNLKIEKEIINEKELFQIICAYRLFLPFANITISTRENSIFRDNIIKIAATKISAGVDTGIGAHTKCSTKKGDEQFEIADKRTVAQIFEKIKSEELQPVMNDYIYLKD
ncbi:ThiH protein [Fusobacterium vincentii ATCC 49256]|uniref:ThiH protein n=2 Tax=Fusobacterium vincentii TaxID=155615 RepID=Q7P416_FUSVC|nr:ThiH protein [Fusobacterium vincentii ATCC 49256]